MKIHTIAVGGTIDKIYFDANSKYKVGEPAVSKMLLDLPLNLDIQVTRLMAKDSLDMTEQNRRLLRATVEGSTAKKILITHGTDTMAETARALVGISDKTVVLTGALAPALFQNSDAQFNVGGALATLQLKEEGVFLVMNGQVFDALNVRKNTEKNRFETLS